MRKGASTRVFPLVILTVAAIVSLQSLPIMVEHGLSLIFYLLIAAFAFFIPTAIVLRYKSPKVYRDDNVMGGNAGMWFVAASVFCIFLGFIPPAKFPEASHSLYVFSMSGGILVLCLIPQIFLRVKTNA